jgi:hypothetical protein
LLSFSFYLSFFFLCFTLPFFDRMPNSALFTRTSSNSCPSSLRQLCKSAQPNTKQRKTRFVQQHASHLVLRYISPFLAVCLDSRCFISTKRPRPSSRPC